MEDLDQTKEHKKEFITVSELAKRWSTTPQTIYNDIHRGYLMPSKASGRTKFDIAYIKQLEENNND
jgi:hypothetical protein